MIQTKKEPLTREERLKKLQLDLEVAESMAELHRVMIKDSIRDHDDADFINAIQGIYNTCIIEIEERKQDIEDFMAEQPKPVSINPKYVQLSLF